MELKYIINKMQYIEAKAAWKKIIKPTAPTLIIYNLLRGFPANRGFTPITNKNKLANGYKAWSTFEIARMFILRALTAPVASQWRTDAQNLEQYARYKDQLLKYGLPYNAELFERLTELCKEQIQNE